MQIVIFVTLLAATSVRAYDEFDSQWETIWSSYKAKYGKRYEPIEDITRLGFFKERIQGIIQHNLEADLGLHTFRRALNQFADLNIKEFNQKFNQFKMTPTSSAPLFSKIAGTFTKDDLPDQVDWRDKGYVTGVGDQGPYCGSCWAFSATGSLEGLHKKVTGNLVPLSAQNLVDCSKPQGNDGCGGGNMGFALDYVIANKGIDTEASYPYKGEDGPCRFSKENVGANCTGYVNLPSDDEKSLKEAVASIGPISVAIDGSHESFLSYKDGIYEEPECNSQLLDHGVLIVGYGTENGIDYWLVKNCWGTSWGMKGYVKIRRNKNNMCGIASYAIYPTL